MQIKGHIQMTTDKDIILFDVENAVTNLWEELVATQGLGVLYSQNCPVEAGQNFLSAPIYSNGGTLDFDKYSDRLITVYLLNLTAAEKEVLSKSSNLLPIYNSSFEVDDSKIVGYATATYTAENEKQGYLDTVSGVNLVNPRRYSLKFQWDAGVLSGTYNAIVIGLNVLNYPYSGFSIYRGIEATNTLMGDVASTGYLIKPGIKSETITITGENEILVGDGTSNSKGRKIINLVTGETTIIESGDARYDFPLLDATYPQIVVGDFLVYSNGSYLYKVDLSTKAQSSIGSTGMDCFVYNGYLYTRYSSTIYRAYTLDTFTYTSSANMTIANMGFPTDYLEENSNYVMGITNCGENYLVYYFYKYSSSTAYVYPKVKALICSNPTNIAGSIIEILPNVNSACCAMVSGKKVLFARYIPFIHSLSGSYRYKNTAGSSANVNKTGLKLTTEGLYGNLLSFKTFEEDQQIPTGEGLKLTYYYTFEQ